MKGGNSKQQKYSRIHRLEIEPCHASRTGCSLQDDDDEFPDNPTTACVNTLACIGGDIYNIQEETSSRDSDIRDDYAWTIKRILTTNLVNDETVLHLYRRLCQAYSGEDADIDDGGLTMVKLIKLWVVSIIGILIVHPLARWMCWEIDENYALRDFIQYDSFSVLLDLFFFFFVGRLYTSSGIDNLSWGIFILLGSTYPSIANDFEFLRHSISMYDIMCSWPVLLYFYALALIVLAIAFSVALIRSHHRRNVLRSRIVEAIVLLCLFFGPYITTDDSFHLHHWFGMWWIGMQSNSPDWWARSFQAFCLGSYLNGIAVYGRDPILGCKYAFYRSTNLQCEYMQCYQGPVGNETGNETEYKDFVAPDWRVCNAAALKNESVIMDTESYNGL